MTDDSPPELEINRDDVINQAFEQLVDDDLDAFLLLTSIDGNIEGVSFSPRYENPEAFDDSAICQLPLMELLGGCIAEAALEYGLPPEEVADVGAHVSVDHLGVDAETAKKSWEELVERAGLDEDASYEEVLDQLRDFIESERQ